LEKELDSLRKEVEMKQETLDSKMKLIETQDEEISARFMIFMRESILP